MEVLLRGQEHLGEVIIESSMRGAKEGVDADLVDYFHNYENCIFPSGNRKCFIVKKHQIESVLAPAVDNRTGLLLVEAGKVVSFLEHHGSFDTGRASRHAHIQDESALIDVTCDIPASQD